MIHRSHAIFQPITINFDSLASSFSLNSVWFSSLAGCTIDIRDLHFFIFVAFFRYEEQLKERESQLQKEDLSDMVAEHAAKQKVSDFFSYSRSLTASRMGNFGWRGLFVANIKRTNNFLYL